MIKLTVFLLTFVLLVYESMANQSVKPSFNLHLAGLNTPGMVNRLASIGSTGVSERLEYDIRWHFMSIGSATIETVCSRDGGTNRTVRRIEVRNHPWVQMLYRVEDRIECVEEETAGHRRACVTKRIHEGGFRQDDLLLIDYETGKAQWKNMLCCVYAEYPIPKGIYDYVSILFILRAQGLGALGQTTSYRLVMDGGVHEIAVTAVSTGTVKTIHGAVVATRLCVQSKSTNLFARNLPKAIWITRDPAMIVAMDADMKLGTVRAVLAKWELFGKEMRLFNPGAYE